MIQFLFPWSALGCIISSMDKSQEWEGGDGRRWRVGCGDGAPNVTPDKPCCIKDVTLVERNDESLYTAAGMNCLVGGLRIA